MQRMASDLTPIAESSLRAARRFAQQTIELDALVMSVARIGKDHPSDSAIFAELHSAVALAYSNYLDNVSKRSAALNMEKWLEDREHTSKAMRKLSQVFKLQSRSANDANQIIVKWKAQLAWLDTSTPSGSGEAIPDAPTAAE